MSMLRKIGSKYSVFVSTFHSGRTSIPNWKMHVLDAFVVSLIQEKDKLAQMGVIQTSKYQALSVGDSNNAKARGKHKGKETKNTNSKPKENRISSDGASSSKKKNKFKKTRYPYCMRGIDQLPTLLEQNNIFLPQGVEIMSDAGENTEEYERFLYLK